MPRHDGSTYKRSRAQRRRRARNGQSYRDKKPQTVQAAASGGKRL